MRFISDAQRKAVFARTRARLGGLREPARKALALGAGIGTALLVRKKLIPYRNPMYVTEHVMPLIRGRKGPTITALKKAANIKNLKIIRSEFMPSMAMDLAKLRLGGGAEMARTIRSLVEMGSSGKTPRRLGRRVVIYTKGDSPAVLAHELGHLRKRNLIGSIAKRTKEIGRNPATGYVSAVQTLEEMLATVRGARVYRKAGGSLRQYGKNVIPGQLTYIAGSGGGRDAPLLAGTLAGGTTYTTLRPWRRKKRGH